jgi:hypothetical protein
MRSGGTAFPVAMNPYRMPSLPEPMRARISLLFRPRGAVRLAVLIPLGAAYAFGWSVGRAAPAVSVHVSAPPLAASPEPPPKALVERPAAAPAPSPAEPLPSRYAMTQAQARATIAARAREAVAAVTRRDMKAVAGLVDPDEGLVIGDVDETVSVTLSPTALARCFADRAVLALDDAVSATCGELWRDHLSGPDFARAPHVDYNLPSPEGYPASMVSAGDGAADPTLRAHPGSIVVQYVVRRPEKDVTGERCGDGEGWATLRLVFDPHGERWQLRAALWRDWLK